MKYILEGYFDEKKEVKRFNSHKAVYDYVDKRVKKASTYHWGAWNVETNDPNDSLFGSSAKRYNPFLCDKCSRAHKGFKPMPSNVSKAKIASLRIKASSVSHRYDLELIRVLYDVSYGEFMEFVIEWCNEHKVCLKCAPLAYVYHNDTLGTNNSHYSVYKIGEAE